MLHKTIDKFSIFSAGYFPVLPWGKCHLQSSHQSQILNLAKRDMEVGVFEPHEVDEADMMDEEILSELAGYFNILLD